MKAKPYMTKTLIRLAAVFFALIIAALCVVSVAADTVSQPDSQPAVSQQTENTDDAAQETAEETPPEPQGFFEKLGAGLAKWWAKLVNNFKKTFVTKDRYKNFLVGLKNTIVISIFATLLGVVIGTMVAIVKVSATRRDSKLRWLNPLCDIYLAVIRGTPALVQLLLMYYVILRSVDNPILVASLAFGINSGAYVAEIIRAGILAVDKGQTEAGRSLGLTGGQTMTRIVLPQAVKNILPALGNEFITLIKETSVAGYITIVDLTKAADIVRGQTYEAFFPLIMVAIVYFTIVAALTWLLRKFERRLARSDRG